MKSLKKGICMMLTFVMAISIAISGSTENVEAAQSAKSVVKSALKYMKAYDTISYTYSLSRMSDGEIERRSGMAASDSKTDHGFYLDESQSQKGWEEYSKKDKVYRKGYSSSEWTVYTVTDYNSKSISSYTEKRWVEYLLGHLKEVKFSNKGVKSYTITAKPNFSSTKVKNITLKIDKKKKCITSIKFSYKNYSDFYLNSTDKFSIKNQVISYTNICYGKDTLKIPSGL